jgi:uncharacterized membrane protein
MTRVIQHLQTRPRLWAAAAIGLAAALLLPGTPHLATRGLFGWNVAVWLYLVLIGAMMLRADHHRLRRVAVAQAESAATVLVLVVLAALASLIGIVVELSAAKAAGAQHMLPHLLFALATVVGSWLLLPTMFALTYASLYYHHGGGSGLNFPEAASGTAVAKGSASAYQPNYVDFLYFSFTLAVASQTADVAISSAAMRKLVLVQALLSFAFNTAILAFTVNIAAGLF